MQDKGSCNKERVELLRRVCRKHQNLYRDSMNGKGIDRHMFGLFVVCKGLGYVSAVLHGGPHSNAIGLITNQIYGGDITVPMVMRSS